jgi:hypothetical protein
MKKYFLIITLLTIGFFTSQAQITLPQPSPKGMVMQTVGVTDITVNYSRPSMKGRNVFGDVVEMDKLWRTGANSATTIEFSSNVTIEGKKLEKGKYAIFTIPSAKEWTFIINKNPNQSGTEQYKESEDALRVKVKTSTHSPKIETFSISFQDVTSNSAHLVLAWDNVMVPVKIETPTSELAMKNIEKAMSSTPANYYRAAMFMMENNLELPKALEYVDLSISMRPFFYNHWVKAQILAKQNNFQEAAATCEKAVELGKAEGEEGFYSFYAQRVEADAKAYREKAGPAKKKKK